MLQLMTEISKGVILSQLPRMLGVYPVISSDQQLNNFAITWKGYGSQKQLQVMPHHKSLIQTFFLTYNHHAQKCISCAGCCHGGWEM